MLTGGVRMTGFLEYLYKRKPPHRPYATAQKAFVACCRAKAPSRTCGRLRETRSVGRRLGATPRERHRSSPAMACRHETRCRIPRSGEQPASTHARLGFPRRARWIVQRRKRARRLDFGAHGTVDSCGLAKARPPRGPRGVLLLRYSTPPLRSARKASRERTRLSFLDRKLGFELLISGMGIRRGRRRSCRPSGRTREKFPASYASCVGWLTRPRVGCRVLLDEIVSRASASWLALVSP